MKRIALVEELKCRKANGEADLIILGVSSLKKTGQMKQSP